VFPGDPVLLGTTPAPKRVTCGYFSSCVLFRDSTLKCWGFDGATNLGIGDSTWRSTDPAKMGANLPFIDFGQGVADIRGLPAMESRANCVLFTDGRVKCWGRNNAGQLGQGTTTTTPASTKAPLVLFSRLGVTPACFRTNQATAMSAPVCQACLPGEFADEFGLLDCKQCSTGRYSRSFEAAESQDTCENCPVNTFSETRGVQECTACPSNFYTTETGQAQCQGECPHGTEPNWVVKGCAPCGVDTYSDTDDSSACKACPTDTIVDILGSTSEDACLSPGEPTTASTCLPGSYFNLATQLCRKCNIGTFQGLPEQSSCRSCPIGHTTASLGGAIYTDCVCPAGSYKDSYGFCERCPQGSVSSVGARFCVCSLLGHVTAGVGDVDCTQVLSCGDAHCCMLYPCLGKVKCWGGNSEGQLDIQNGINQGRAAAEMGANLRFMSIQNVKRVDCAGRVTYFEMEVNGKKVFKTIGRNTNGALFFETTNNNYGVRAGETLASSPIISADTFGATELIGLTNNGLTGCALLWFGEMVSAAGGRSLKKTQLKCTSGKGGLIDSDGSSGIPGGQGGASLLNLRAVDFGTDYYPIECIRSDLGLSTCARMQTGDLKCWGHNSEGTLGIGDQLVRGQAINSMGDNLPVLNFGSNYMIQMSLNAGCRCATLDNKKAKCWGSNRLSQAGIGSYQNPILFPTYVLLDDPIIRIETSGLITIALFSSNRVKAWG
jgi:alpha-tubulin suppressor-like RCC1 family protein